MECGVLHPVCLSMSGCWRSPSCHRPTWTNYRSRLRGDTTRTRGSFIVAETLSGWCGALPVSYSSSSAMLNTGFTPRYGLPTRSLLLTCLQTESRRAPLVKRKIKNTISSHLISSEIWPSPRLQQSSSAHYRQVTLLNQRKSLRTAEWGYRLVHGW